MREKRKGIFYMSDDLAGGGIAPEIFAGLGFVPYRVEYLAIDQRFQYIGTSFQFEAVPAGCIIPEYEITITETDDPDDDLLIIKAVKNE